MQTATLHPFDALIAHWHDWRSTAARRRREREDLQTLATLDHRTMQDIGWPDDMRRATLLTQDATLD